MQGIHPHPGPPCIRGPQVSKVLSDTIDNSIVVDWESNEPGVNIEVQNVTCAKTHFDDMLNTEAQFMFVSEHSANNTTMGILQHKAHQHGCKFSGGPLDPNVKSHNLGGVGCLSTSQYIAIQIKPITPEFRNAVASGRCMLYNIEVGGGLNCFVYCIYGFTGAHSNKCQAFKTARLGTAIKAELDAQVCGPTCIVGDVNADLADIHSLQSLIIDLGWIGLGAKARIWGQPDNEFTCVTANTKVPTRRDFVLANPELFPLVTNFGVVHGNVFPTHSILRFRVSPCHA